MANIPKISVVVPVYNTEKFLHRCIDSVLAQTFTDWELLLIDDGSKDSSGAICETYVAKDARIRVIHKENTGVSDTRNLGLDVARGKYLLFLDADDFWLQSDSMSMFVQKAEEHNLDIVRGEYSAMHEDGSFAWSRRISKKRKQYAERVLYSGEFLEYGIHGEFFLPLSMFKRSRIGNLRFEKGRVFLEDMLFYSTFLLQDLKCMYLPNIRFYGYRKNENSASNKVSVKQLADSFSMCYRFHNLAQNTRDVALKNKFVYNSIMMYYWTLETVAMKAYYPQRKRLIIELKLEILIHDVRNWIRDSSQLFFSPIFYLSPLGGVKLMYVGRLWNALKHELKMFVLKR